VYISSKVILLTSALAIPGTVVVIVSVTWVSISSGGIHCFVSGVLPLFRTSSYKYLLI
jgi:hypothetical protein